MAKKRTAKRSVSAEEKIDDEWMTGKIYLNMKTE